MVEVRHRYYCGYCERFVLGETLPELVRQLNLHNSVRHPADCSDWTTNNMVLSAHYTGPTENPNLKTISIWGTAQHPPTITDRDAEFLALGGVKW